MKKLLLLPLLLLVVACTPDEPTSVEVALQEPLQAIEASRLSYYPYFTEWEVCEINGQTYEQVSFLYTDLGLGYIVDDVVTYRADMEVTYCQGVIIEEINK